MAARQTLIVVLGAILSWGGNQTPATFVEAASQAAPPRASASRIVSLVPAVTEMLFAIGAGPQVVGISSFDTFPPEVKTLPRVGALLDPDTERILSLRPGLVAIYASQAELQARLERAGIRVFVLRHGGIAETLTSLRDLGVVTGRKAEADRLTASLQAQVDAVRVRVRSRPHPRTLLVVERQPKTLRNMYASGGVGFLHDMLTAAGGMNVFADVDREAVQPSHETLLARAPEVVIEISAAGMLERAAVDADRDAWSILPSLPAVRTGRIHRLVGEHLIVPGPRLAQGVDALARALHPDAFP